MNKKDYFVIIWGLELEMKGSLAKRIVYAAIKSFSANGKRDVHESYLSISKRAGVSDKWVRVCVEQLVKDGWLQVTGKGTKRGGSYPILKVHTQDELKKTKSSDAVGAFDKRSSDTVPSSSTSVKSSSNSVDKFKLIKEQSKKVIQNKDNFELPANEIDNLLGYVNRESSARGALEGGLK